MNDLNEIIRVGVDAYKGRVTKYSTQDSMELLHKALVEANNGSTVLDYKAIRDGKCVGLFSIVEEILTRTINDGLTNDMFFMSMVDFRNIGAGDKNEFQIADSELFQVGTIADGSQAVRRQRLGGWTKTSIETTVHAVKIYEELGRVLSGQVDFNHFITKVSESFRQNMLNEIYTLWNAATATDFGGTAYFPAAGAYDEETLLTLIEHVEAAAGGKKATIIGTKAALRPLAPVIDGIDAVGNEYKSDLYNMGYAGKFFGSNVVCMPQRHKVNSTEFLLDDKTLTIVAGDDKPIKYVTEGQSLIIPGNALDNADLTQTYFCTEKTGLGLVLAGGNSGIGRYQMI